jgi:hypothetical protein
MRRTLPGVLAVLWVAACTFAPDLSRFVPCDAQGRCPSGSTCLTEEARCVPDCGDPETCDDAGPRPGDDAGDSGADAGVDGGVDAGVDGGADAGPDGGADAGADGGDAGPALALEPDGLPMGVEGAPYSGRLSARGGTPPYTFTATLALPAGLTLDGEGQLSGTPAAAGDFFISVDVTDQGTPPKRASGSVPLRVRPRLRLAGPSTLADAPRGLAYTERLSATGGKPPYHFTLAPGSALPAGLGLADGGTVTGTSGQVGTVDFTARVTDSDSPPQEATRALSVTTVDTGLALRMMTRALPDGRVGAEYSYTLRAAGATGAYSWAVQDGELPPGVLLDASQGLLHGTPSRPGTYTVRISVADLAQLQDRTLTLRVD